MVLEACMLCLDNSAYARDADVSPSRLIAQEETAGIVAGAKTSVHHENAVGVLTYGGDRVTVHLSPTSDMGAVLSALHGLQCGGETDFTRGIQIAQLALKHRMNKNQKQRIIVFVGSPLRCSEKQLTVLGKQLKKNNVAVDVISFGEVEANAAKLRAFHEAVDSNGTSCLLESDPQPGQLLSDVVLQSRLLHDPDAAGGEGGGLRVIPGAGAAGGAAAGMDFGVDPNADPELYMALQLSLQEDQQRTRQEGTRGEVSSGGSGPASAIVASPALTRAPAAAGVVGGAATDIPTAEQIEMMEGIDDELRQALLLSLQDFSGGPGTESGSSSAGDGSSAEAGDIEVAREASHAAVTTAAGALAEGAGEGVADVNMTVEGAVAEDGGVGSTEGGAATNDGEPGTGTVREGDPLARMLDSLPGVDVSDPRMQEALRAATAAEAEEEEAQGHQGAGSDTHQQQAPGAAPAEDKSKSERS